MAKRKSQGDEKFVPKGEARMDVDNPFEERRDAAGRKMLALNQTEMEVVRVDVAFDEWRNGEYDTYSDALVGNGHSRVTSREIERLIYAHDSLFQNIATFIVECYLDIEVQWTMQEIADQIGIHKFALKRFQEDERFAIVYNTHFKKLKRDPRIAIIEDLVPELVPLWYQALLQLLTGDVPPSVRFNVLKWFADAVGLSFKQEGDDVRQLTDFLRQHNVNSVNIIQNNLSVPPEYRAAIDDVVEGEITEDG